MIRIKEETVISTNSTNGVATVDAVIIVSSSENLPEYNGIPGRILVPGSAAVVPSEGVLYMMDFDNTWKEWGAE